MFSKQVLYIYTSIFLCLTICNSGTSAEGPVGMLRPQPPAKKPGGGVLWTFENYAGRLVTKVDHAVTTLQGRVAKTNTKISSVLSKVFSGTAKPPYMAVNTLLTMETFVFGRLTFVIAGVLEVVNQNATGQKVIKFGSSVQECYQTNKQNVFKTAVNSTSTCFGEESQTVVGLLNTNIASVQGFIVDVEMVLKEMQNCMGTKCNAGAAKTFAMKIRESAKSLLMNLLQTAKIGAAIPPKTAKCLGNESGMATVQQLRDMGKDFAGCVSKKMKKKA